MKFDREKSFGIPHYALFRVMTLPSWTIRIKILIPSEIRDRRTIPNFEAEL